MKKTIIIISVILGILALLAGVYFAWQKTQTILTPPGSSTSSTPSVPSVSFQASNTTVPALKLKILSNEPVFDYWILTATSSVSTASSTVFTRKIFYINQDGKIFSLSEDGKSEAVTTAAIQNLQAVKPSFDGKRIIIKYGDFISPKFIIFNAESGNFEILPENILAADFSPDAKQIVYLQKSSAGSAAGNLVIKDLTGTKPKTTAIMPISQKDFDLNWILSGKIILTPKPSAFYSSSVWVVDTKAKTISAFGIETSGLMLKWAADGKMGLRFSTQLGGGQGGLSLINEQGVTQALFEAVTLPEKCFISEPQIYCAFPQSIPAKTVLPDDYLKQAIYFKDSLYKIDTDKNSISEILDGSNNAIDAVNLNLMNNKLLFINRYDGALYGLELQ